jgi:hypothetical protein
LELVSVGCCGSTPNYLFSAVQIRIRPAVAVVTFFLTQMAVAGGVRAVAGNAFNAEVRGNPLSWAGGTVQYYTDLGPLGSLTNAEANAFVDGGFTRWTSVSTAALSAVQAGTLDQDVNGSNVFVASGTLTLPADIQPTAIEKPIAVVYDHDGAVIDTLLGTGASAPAECLANGVIGGPDAYNTSAHYTHALIIINGRCLSGPGDLPRMRYLLLRVLGKTLGLGWSQLNDNLATGSPPPTVLDAAGLPIMHPSPLLCGPIFPHCIADADQLRMDDRAAISRLYPITEANVSSFPGKLIFADTTARLHGSVRFTLPNGTPGQPMQGVNVIARRVEAGLPSRVVAASSISGHLFRGHAGNRGTGYHDPIGGRFDDFGSTDAALEGHFDLAGLELPDGGTTATYELSIEAVNPLYTGPKSVGPYRGGGVFPSGSFAPVLVQVEKGASVLRNIAIPNSAKPPKDAFEPNSFHSVPEVPASGEWHGTISGYGDEDFFRFRAQQGRTFHLRVTALDDDRRPTRQKLLPVLGTWLGPDFAESPPQIAALPLNSLVEGTTDLAATIAADGTIKLGILDDRGDGRPDFRYHAKLLYMDSASPARIGTNQTAEMVLRGIGFRHGMTVKIGELPAAVRYTRTSEMGITAPSQPNGTYPITVESGDGAQAMINAGVTYGSVAPDVIANLSVPNPVIGLGSIAPNPIRIRVTNAGLPIAGAVVTFTIAPAQSQLSCGSSVCTLLTDQSGEASVRATLQAAGANTVTAQLDNGASVATTIVATDSAATLVASAPFISVVAGDTLSLPITMQYSVNGVPSGGTTLNAGVAGAGGSLTTSAPVTNAAGMATTTLNLVNASNPVNVTACAPATSVCAQTTVQPVAASSLQIVPVSGNAARVLVGSPVPPLRFRVLATVTPFTPITQAPVGYTIVITTPPGTTSCPPEGPCTRQSVRVLSSVAGLARTNADGFLEIVPAVSPGWGPVQVTVTATITGAPQQSAEIHVVVP